MAWTQADAEKLRQAINDGSVIQSMTFSDGTSITMRSVDEQLRVLERIERSLNTGPTTRYASTSKGA